MYTKLLKQLSQKNGTKYEFILKGGIELKPALFFLYKKVWHNETIPETWTHTTVCQIWKRKGDQQDQKNMRNLNLKEDVTKVFGHMIMNSVKETLYKNMGMFQIGSKPGHRPTEHIFVMKSIIQMFNFLKKPLIICFFDYMTFFDSENLCDVMNELYNCGVTGKLYRLLYKMNENSLIQVKTPVGRTRTIKRKEGLSQGTVEASALSSGNIRKGVEEYFGDSDHEVFYGDVRLQPMSFVDDVARMAASRLAAQAGNNLMQTLAETKLLNYHLDKSSFMVVGESKVTDKMEEELKKNPLMLCS